MLFINKTIANTICGGLISINSLMYVADIVKGKVAQIDDSNIILAQTIGTSTVSYPTYLSAYFPSA